VKVVNYGVHQPVNFGGLPAKVKKHSSNGNVTIQFDKKFSLNATVSALCRKHKIERSAIKDWTATVPASALTNTAGASPGSSPTRSPVAAKASPSTNQSSTGQSESGSDVDAVTPPPANPKKEEESTLSQEQVANTDAFTAGERVFVWRYPCYIKSTDGTNADVHFCKDMKSTKKKDTILAKIKEAGMKDTSLDGITQDMTVPVSILSKNKAPAPKPKPERSTRNSIADDGEHVEQKNANTRKLMMRQRFSVGTIANHEGHRIRVEANHKGETIDFRYESDADKPEGTDDMTRNKVPIDAKFTTLDGRFNGAQINSIKARRRLGWKPSHDIPRRREGFHHSFVSRVLRESERKS